MSEQYQWDDFTIGKVLSSFFVGYVLTQMAGGFLSKWLGGKVVLWSGVALWSCFTIVTPIAAQLAHDWGDLTILLAARVGMGVFEGLNFPSVFEISAGWLPHTERSRLATIISVGMELGTLTALLLGPFMCDHLGWETMFYIFGLVGLVWCIIFYFLAADRPHLHPFITDRESKYITSNLHKDDENESPPFADDSSNKTKEAINIVRFLVSPALWGIAVAHTCFNFGWYILLSWLPKYFLSLGVPFEQVGIYSMLPYLTMAITMNIAGLIADVMIGRLNLGIAFTRKTMQSISFFGSAFFLALLRFSPSVTWSSVIMCCAVGCASFCRAGFNINHLDITKRYVGPAMGFTNSWASLPGVFGNLITGWILSSNDDSQSSSNQQWNAVWNLIIYVYIFGGVVYWILGRGKLLYK